jgi:hypothetical protein
MKTAGTEGRRYVITGAEVRGELPAEMPPARVRISLGVVGAHIFVNAGDDLNRSTQSRSRGRIRARR